MSKSILIVDNSPIIRKVLHEELERRGFQVCGEAANGREGIEKAQQLKPDLVVLDLSMPVMNGIEAARELLLVPAFALANVHELRHTSSRTTSFVRWHKHSGIKVPIARSIGRWHSGAARFRLIRA